MSSSWLQDEVGFGSLWALQLWVLLLLISVLSELSAETEAEKLSTDRVRPTCRVEDERRVDSICRHLEQHFSEQIDFATLAKLLRMDRASLCRFFKRATGRTMTTYLNEYRVGAAAQLLVQTDATLLDIAFRVGFGNYSNFHRRFKQIKGYSPRVLRQQLASTTETSVPVEPSQQKYE